MSWQATAFGFCLKEIIRFLIYSALLWGFFRLRWSEAFSQLGFLNQLAVSVKAFWDYGWAVWVLAGYGGILLLVIALYVFDWDELARRREALDKNIEERAAARANELAARFIAEKKAGIEADQRAHNLYHDQLAQWDKDLKAEQRKIDAWKAEMKQLRGKDESWKGQRQAILGRAQTAIHVLEETPPNVEAALRHLKKAEKEPLRGRKER